MNKKLELCKQYCKEASSITKNRGKMDKLIEKLCRVFEIEKDDMGFSIPLMRDESKRSLFLFEYLTKRRKHKRVPSEKV